MVNFTAYFETMVSHKPEWRRAFIDYPALNELLGKIKAEFKKSKADGVKATGTLNAAGSGPRSSSVSPGSYQPPGEGDEEKLFDVSSRNGEARRSLANHGEAVVTRADDHSMQSFQMNKDGKAVIKSMRDLKAMKSPTNSTRNLEESAAGLGTSGAGNGGIGGGGSKNSSSSKGKEQVRQQQGLDAPLIGSSTPLMGSTTPPAEHNHHQRTESENATKVSPTYGGADATYPLPPASSEGGTRASTATQRLRSTSVHAAKILDEEREQLAIDVPRVGVNAIGEQEVDEQEVDGRDGVRMTLSEEDKKKTSPPLSLKSGGGVSRSRNTSMAAVPRSGSSSKVDVPNASLAAAGEESTGTAILNLISNATIDICEKFESLLVLECAKANQFAVHTCDTFKVYFENLQKNSIGQDNPKRVKDNMRYLHGELNYLVEFIETCILAIKTALKKYKKCHPWFVMEEINESVLLPPFQKSEDEITELRKAVEAAWADNFSEGSIKVARTTIQGRPASPGESFRAGFLAAMILACFLYWLHIWFELRPDPTVSESFARMYPVMRLTLGLTWSFVCWAWVLWICNKYRINYLYVFQLSQLSSITWMRCLEYSLLMFFAASFCSCLYVRSELNNTLYGGRESGFRVISPWIFPVFILVFILSIAFPYRHVFRRTRDSFFAVFIKCCMLPFGYVRFVDFFIADWGTSFPYSLGDLLYTVCYYLGEPQEAYLNNPTSQQCHWVRSHYWFPVALIPYIWRACQTFKMWRRTGQLAHLINHGKYISMSLAYLTQWWAAFNHTSESLAVVVWIVHAGSQFYAYVWDVLMDWGWIKLRSRRTMLKTMLPYWSAIVFDFIARMYFIPLYIYVTPIIGMPNTIFIQAQVEIFRRAMWSIFRIENENINNLETYRSIDFVPKVVIPT